MKEVLVGGYYVSCQKAYPPDRLLYKVVKGRVTNFFSSPAGVANHIYLAMKHETNTPPEDSNPNWGWKNMLDLFSKLDLGIGVSIALVENFTIKYRDGSYELYKSSSEKAVPVLIATSVQPKHLYSIMSAQLPARKKDIILALGSLTD